VPIVVFTDADSRELRGINGLHVLTFKPSAMWTVITLVNGDTVTVTEHFDDVVRSLLAHQQAG
jgi:uncharacterized protein YlzI (FlbEa/FlbD family)